MNLKKIPISFLGLSLLSIGLNLLIFADIGLSPFDSLTLLIGNITGLNFGNAALLVHFSMLIILVIIHKKINQTIKELVLSLLSIFIITRFINLYAFLLILSGLSLNSLSLFIIGFLLFALGLAIYINLNIIIAPYDKLVVGLQYLTKQKIGTLKVFLDIGVTFIVIIINLLTVNDVKISLVTLFLMFGTGIMINIYNKLFVNKWIESYN